MQYAYRFRLNPTTDQRDLLDYHRDTCRQLYNHTHSTSASSP
nr:helix-turn-helix domain-containing protein [Haloquadratum walsbyi]